MPKLTANSTLAVRRGTLGDWTEFTATNGLGAFQQFSTRRTRPVPSIAPILAVQRLSIIDGSVQFTIDDNPISHPLFFLRSGDVFQVRIREDGDGAGKHEAIVTGPASINKQDAPGGVRSFVFNLTATNGTEGTQ